MHGGAVSSELSYISGGILTLQTCVYCGGHVKFTRLDKLFWSCVQLPVNLRSKCFQVSPVQQTNDVIVVCAGKTLVQGPLQAVNGSQQPGKRWVYVVQSKCLLMALSRDVRMVA
jgi:hypothetical protein